MTATLKTDQNLATPRRRMRDRGERVGTGGKTVAYAFLAILILYFLIPIWWLFVASTKTIYALFNGPSALWFSGKFSFFTNIADLFSFSNGLYAHWLLNSVIYAGVGGVGATVLAVLAGYGFAKYHFAGRRVSFAILLGAVMVPATALVIPTFTLFANAGITNTMWAVILPSLLNPFGVYLMLVYTTDAVPDELMDAARVDGAGEFRVFLQVALPLLRPAVVTVLLLSVVAIWNNYFLPLVMLQGTALLPVPVGLGVWESQAGVNNGSYQNYWTLIITGALISIIPLVIAFLSLQRYWRGGLAIGSLK
jgi:multiple sugar transport system permease protein